jgi:hypothetical protein
MWRDEAYGMSAHAKVYTPYIRSLIGFIACTQIPIYRPPTYLYHSITPMRASEQNNRKFQMKWPGKAPFPLNVTENM